MSADNGIYIGKFNNGEIRVIHAQAIENLWYPDSENAGYIVSYFKGAATFTNEAEAQRHAFKMENDILSDDFGPILEYGIKTLTFSKSFKDYEEEVTQMVNEVRQMNDEIEAIYRDEYEEEV